MIKVKLMYMECDGNAHARNGNILGFQTWDTMNRWPETYERLTPELVGHLVDTVQSHNPKAVMYVVDVLVPVLARIADEQLVKLLCWNVWARMQWLQPLGITQFFAKFTNEYNV